ncbi:MAG: class I SAM-dependent methyltransferase [Candidatus Omnitrophota bacterium]
MSKERATKILLRTCPVCGNSSGETLHTQRFVIPQGHPLPSSYDVVACLKCGFVFADSQAGQKAYDHYYSQFSKYEDSSVATGSGIKQYDKERSDNTAKEISIYLKDKDAAIVDIGCANGNILDSLVGLGYKNAIGVDPSPACVKFIQNKLGESSALVGGLFSGPILENSSMKGVFDCVILSHVMEHIYDVQSALKNVSKLLKNGGILFVEVPDALRYNEYFIVPYYYFDCEHINHFDSVSINNLLMLNDFEETGLKQWEIRVTENQLYPVIDAIYTKVARKAVGAGITKSDKARSSVIEYIERSAKNEGLSVIGALAKTMEPIIVWGAGSFTQRLLKDTDLAKCNIVAFVDKDSKKWGAKINGYDVKPPEYIKSAEGTILICAALFSKDIINEIISMGVKNKYLVAK